MMYKIERTEEQINEVLNWAIEGVDTGTRYSGASYEQGVQAAIEWILGWMDDSPIGD
jgi:hypothetical protein